MAVFTLLMCNTPFWGH